MDRAEVDSLHAHEVDSRAYLTVRLFGRTDDWPDLQPIVDLLRDDPSIQALRPGQSLAWAIAGWGSALAFHTARSLAGYPRDLIAAALSDAEFVGVLIRRPSPSNLIEGDPS